MLRQHRGTLHRISACLRTGPQVNQRSSLEEKSRQYHVPWWLHIPVLHNPVGRASRIFVKSDNQHCMVETTRIAAAIIVDAWETKTQTRKTNARGVTPNQRGPRIRDSQMRANSSILTTLTEFLLRNIVGNKNGCRNHYCWLSMNCDSIRRVYLVLLRGPLNLPGNMNLSLGPVTKFSA